MLPPDFLWIQSFFYTQEYIFSQIWYIIPLVTDMAPNPPRSHSALPCTLKDQWRVKDVVQLVKCLPTMYEALSRISSPP